MMKKYFLFLAGFLVGVILAEVILRRIKGNPPPLKSDREFHRIYLQIREPFFLKDRISGMYLQHRLWKGGQDRMFFFPADKGEIEKRVFVVGESVAELYDEIYLGRRLKEVFPGFDWTVVNCGVGGYDSYSILLVVREIVRYDPDLVIFLMGNNDGMRKTVKINTWPYRYNFVAKFWVTRIVSEYLDPPIRLESIEEIRTNFKKNVQKIAGILTKNKVPSVIVTLPQHKNASLGQLCPEDREVFEITTLFQKKKWESIIERLRPMAKDAAEASPFSYYLEKSLRNTGVSKIGENLIHSGENPFLAEILRETCRKYSSLVLVDFAKEVRSFFHGPAGFELFFDTVHLWPPGYEWLSESVLEALFSAARERRIAFPQPGAEWSSGAKSVLVEDVFARSQRVSGGGSEYLLRGPRHIFIDIFQKERFNEFTRIFLLYWFERDPELLLHFPQKIESLLGRPPLSPFRERYGASFKIMKHWDQVLSFLGETFRVSGYYRQALEFLKAAEEANPGNYHIALFRGLCYYDMSERKKAGHEFLRLRALKPEMGWLDIAFLDSLCNPAESKK